MNAPCPDCGGKLNALVGKKGYEVVTDAAGIPKHITSQVVYACSGCEFVFKLPTGVW